jgi:hypothetical protein
MMERLGGIEDLKQSELVLPTPEFFPRTDTEGHARAQFVFERVKELARMPEWPCKLVAQPPRPDARVSDIAFLKQSGGLPLGTFGVDGNEVVITYDPGSLDDPISLVSTLAHELSHYLLSSKGEPPGGWDNHEFATDLAVVYLGFGLFSATTAFRYYSGSHAWGYSRQGYLSQSELTFALAVFVALRDQPISDLKPWLAPHLMSGIAKSARYLAQNPERLAPLRTVSS